MRIVSLIETFFKCLNNNDIVTNLCKFLQKSHWSFENISYYQKNFRKQAILSIPPEIKKIVLYLIAFYFQPLFPSS